MPRQLDETSDKTESAETSVQNDAVAAALLTFVNALVATVCGMQQFL